MQLWDTSLWFRGPRYPVPVRNKRRMSGRSLAVSWGIGLTIGVAAAIAFAWRDGLAQRLEPTALQINWEILGWPD
ncbi:MAG: hypothetical protein ACYTGX_08810 [Planctomycetota bacterium]|jgi:hypothetical protein